MLEKGPLSHAICILFCAFQRSSMAHYRHAGKQFFAKQCGYTSYGNLAPTTHGEAHANAAGGAPGTLHTQAAKGEKTSSWKHTCQTMRDIYVNRQGGGAHCCHHGKPRKEIRSDKAHMATRRSHDIAFQQKKEHKWKPVPQNNCLMTLLTMHCVTRP